MAGRAIISWLVGTSSNDLGFISKSCKARSMHRSSNLFLNRIMFDATELSVVSGQSEGYLATVTLPKDDYRTRHIAKTLNLQNGDCVRAGCVRDRDPSEFDSLGGLMTDEAFVEWLPEGKIKKASPTRNREPPGSLKVLIPNPPKTSLWEDRYGAETDDTPRVSLLLALPRPLQLQRWGLFIQCENSLEFWTYKLSHQAAADGGTTWSRKSNSHKCEKGAEGLFRVSPLPKAFGVERLTR